jgi:hypothetical protein
MTKLSLDAEPPSKFDGKKEVNRKKNGTIPQLIIFLRTNKNNITKNLEKKVIADGKNNIINFDYTKNETTYSEENLTSTNKIEFVNTNLSINQAMLNSHYMQKENNFDFTRKDISKLYNMNSSYSFIPHIKEENKKEDLSVQSKEQESKEIQYPLYNFDEELTQEN